MIVSIPYVVQITELEAVVLDCILQRLNPYDTLARGSVRRYTARVVSGAEGRLQRKRLIEGAGCGARATELGRRSFEAYRKNGK